MKGLKIVSAVIMMLGLGVGLLAGETNATAPATSQNTAPKSKTDFGFGIEFGNVTINGVNYNQIRLQPDLNFGKFGVGLDLNIEFDAQGNIRAEEWNSWQAILSKITYLRYGRKHEKPVYVKIGGIKDFTLGHGLIVYQYNNMLNYPSVKKMGLAFDMDLGVFGWESMVGNILDFDILGFRGYVRPLFNSNIPIIKTLEIGGTIAADLDPLNTVSSNTPYDFTDNTNSKAVTVWGADVGMTVLNILPLSMLSYVDIIGISGKGTGEVLGLTGKIIKFIPYRLEVQILQKHFITRYFDSFYDANRAGLYQSLDAITNGYAGMLFSSGLSLLDNKLSFLFTIKDSFGDTTLPELQFDFIIDKALLKKVGFKFSWYRKNILNFSDIFKFEDANSLMLTELQYMVSDNLALILQYRRTFEMDASGNVVPFTSTSISTKMMF